MLAYAAFALVLLVYRQRQRQLERDLAKSIAQTAALHELARRLLAVRDMANTPLQALELDVALAKRIRSAGPIADRMRRSLARLREWQRLLDPSEQRVKDWTAGHESFDARRVLDDTAVGTAERPLRRRRSPPAAT